MSNIWLDPFGISLIKSKQSKHNPPPPPPPAPAAEEPQVQTYYTLPCYQYQMPQQLIFYNVNANTPFCNQFRPVVAPQCHCQHKKPDDKKPDDKKKKPAAPKKPVDEKKKKKEEEQKKKELALAKEKEDRKNVKPTFSNPRTPRKGVFER